MSAFKSDGYGLAVALEATRILSIRFVGKTTHNCNGGCENKLE